MQPYSSDMDSPNHEMIAPITQRVRVKPTLPTDLTMDPGVAKIPLPITLEMIKTYADPQPKFLPDAAVSGITSYSTVRDISGSTPSSSELDVFEKLL
jgi:hypothetical protein